MTKLSAHQKIIVELRKIIKQVDIYSANLAQNNGLTVSQLNILQDLVHEGKMSMPELAKKSLISKQTASEILHRLEKKELIKREKSEQDKRLVYYSLSELGKEVLDKAPQLLQEIFIKEFDSLEDWEQNMLLANLQRVSSMLKASDIDASPILSPNPDLYGDIEDSSIIPIVKRPIETNADVFIATTVRELEKHVSVDDLSKFMFENMKPFNDTLQMTRQGILDSLTGVPSKGGFIVLGKMSEKIAGAVVMLATGMSAYIPEYCLLFASVDKRFRNYSIGQQLIEAVTKNIKGDMYLHVEYDNRAKRLYERMGFVNKYAEMRFYLDRTKM
jgi:DNA-binding MarR family transcriptional regulator/ribosomal protein S18 acetylase RimI-like enzyme